ncbi:hypothetical protein FRC00_007503 [Tulasnella sp. 408]|nr:hypothetical protein FRC00_007503 [Tulasnella sp. 408]
MTATFQHQIRKPATTSTTTRRRPSALIAARLSQKPCAPRPLPIPNIAPIKAEKVWACAPQCAGKSPESVLREITRPQVQSRYIRGIQLFDSSRSSAASAPSVPITQANSGDDHAIMPSHMIRVHDGKGRRPLLFPFHDVHLATHFSSVSQEAVAAPFPQPEGWQHMVDIVLPAPETFVVFRDYVYTRSIDGLMASLLPLPGNKAKMLQRGASAEATARFYARELTGAEIISRAALVHTVYSNAIRLGMRDETFWRCLLLAWKIISRALQIWQDQQAQRS